MKRKEKGPFFWTVERIALRSAKSNSDSSESNVSERAPAVGGAYGPAVTAELADGPASSVRSVERPSLWLEKAASLPSSFFLPERKEVEVEGDVEEEGGEEEGGEEGGGEEELVTEERGEGEVEEEEEGEGNSRVTDFFWTHF